MKVWIDVCNTPQGPFAEALVERLREKGCDYFITARAYSNTLEWLDKSSLDYMVVGRHYGASSVMKLFGFFIRCLQLVVVVRKNKVSMAFSQSSFYSPVVSRLLCIPSLYTNDNELAKGNVLGNLFSTISMYPASLENFYSGRKIRYYHGVKEAIYLKPLKFVPPSRLRVLFRPEPDQAQYHRRWSHDSYRELFLRINSRLSCPIDVIPRNLDQADYIRRLNMPFVNILDSLLSLEEICKRYMVFVGAGGSMCRELALLGVTVVSVFQHESGLSVDNYLKSRGLMYSSIDDYSSRLKDCENSDGESIILGELKLGAKSFSEIVDTLTELGNRQ